MELMVSMVLFSIVGLAVTGYIVDTLRRVGLEARAALASQELSNAYNLLKSELRMAIGISPYNVGNDPSLVTCAAQLTVSGTAVRFLVTHDDASGASGMQPYYIGYEYDPVSSVLYRGEVAAGSTTSCALPGTDPLAPDVRQILARNVTAVDFDNDGAVDPVFSFSNPRLQVNLGMRVTGPDNVSIQQKVSDGILIRAL